MCWNDNSLTSSNPTINDNKISLGKIKSTGCFETTIQDLIISTNYNLRVYIIDDTIHYGNVVSAYHGDFWNNTAEFEGKGRQGAVGLSFNNKGYAGLGYGYNWNYSSSEYMNDFWEYNPENDSWTKKAYYPGHDREYAAGFAVNDKIYIGTGYYYSNAFNESYVCKDFWEYDPLTNSWSQKNDFVEETMQAIGFSINNTGYILNDNKLYEYKVTEDNWIEKSGFPANMGHRPVIFSFNDKSFLLTYYNDLWEYNKSTDSWYRKSDFPGLARYGAVAFSIGSKGYVGTGYDYSNGVRLNDFWVYDSQTDIWLPVADFKGGVRKEAVGFSIGNKGYVGTGDVSDGYSSYFYEYNP